MKIAPPRNEELVAPLPAPTHSATVMRATKVYCEPAFGWKRSTLHNELGAFSYTLPSPSSDAHEHGALSLGGTKGKAFC